MSTIKAGTTTTTAFSVDQDTTGDLNFQAGSVTPLSIKSTGLVSVSNTASFKLPVGGMASRPASPQNGMMRFNSDLNEVEVYSGGEWQVISSGNLKLKLDFDETTTLDSRISFTRATNGTYFDSAGVLQTAGSGVARFDHRLENGSWVNKGLLIEEQRTNVSLYSEELSNGAAWNVARGSITTNQIAAPDGTTTADKYKEDSQTGFHGVVHNLSFPSATTSTFYTASGFIKKISRQYAQVGLQQRNANIFVGSIAAIIDLDTGLLQTTESVGTPPTDVSTSIQNVGNGWYRVCVTGKTAASGVDQVNVTMSPSTSTTSNYAGNNTSEVYFWGAQLEQGAFPTSYIKTTSASVTRNADIASMTSTNFSSWYNATEGTVFCQFSFNGLTLPGGNAQIVWNISDGTANERMQINTITDNPVNLSYFLFRDGGSSFDISSPDPRKQAFINTTYKSCSAYKLNNNATSLDGVAPTTLNTVTMPTVNNLNIGANQLAAGQSNMHIAKFYYWNTRRTNQVLQNLTE